MGLLGVAESLSRISIRRVRISYGLRMFRWPEWRKVLPVKETIYSIVGSSPTRNAKTNLNKQHIKIMELKLQPDIKAAVEIDGQPIINLENSVVYENIGKEEAFLYIKSIIDNKEIKIKFLKNKEENN